MKGVRITGIVVFLIAAFATAGLPMDGPSSGALHSFTLPSAQCTDVVRGGILPPEQAGYLRSGEFADSLDSVASGTSYYSPGVVPAGWKASASTWKEQINGRSVIRFGAVEGGTPASVGTRSEYREANPGEGICPSSLIFRAFLDYRAKTGQPDLKPVYPYQVRKASAELSERFARVTQRARRIETSILEAERMGARECSPSELSIAWAELEIAGRQAAENGYDIGKTEAVFASAERASANLLVKRQVASSQKFVCYSR